MKYGVDMTYPPTTDQASKMNQLGYTVCGVYIGGPRAAAHTAWHQVDGFYYPVRSLVPYFSDGFILFYVGRNLPWDKEASFCYSRGISDGNDANIQAGACGFGSAAPICLDIEADTSAGVPDEKLDAYLKGMRSVVSDVAGHVFGGYGTPEFCNRISQLTAEVDFTIMADPLFEGRVDYEAPVGYFDPSEPPPSDGWQFGGGSVANVAVDFDSFTDSFVFATYGG